MTNDTPGLHFTNGQNRIITTSITLFCSVVMGVAAISFFLLLLKSLDYFSNIIGPVIVAFFLSLLTRPWYGWLKAKLGGRQVPAILLFSLSFLIPLGLFCFFFGSFILTQGTSLIRALPSIIAETRNYLSTTFPDFQDIFNNIYSTLTGYFTNEGSLAWTKIGSMLQTGVHLGGSVFSFGSVTLLWLLTFFYWIIFVMYEPLDGDRFVRHLPFLSTTARTSLARYFKNFTEIIVSYFRGQIIDVSIQGLIYGITFQIIGLPNGFIIGLVFGWLNLVPYLGVITGLSIALPIAFFSANGGLNLAIIVMVVFCCVQTFDGYVMQPYIQGGRMKLSAWQIVFALLFWTQLGGFLGLLLAIPLTAFVKASWDEWRDSSARFLSTQASTLNAAPTKGSEECQK